MFVGGHGAGEEKDDSVHSNLTGVKCLHHKSAHETEHNKRGWISQKHCWRLTITSFLRLILIFGDLNFF